jgi:hypothetical protein
MHDVIGTSSIDHFRAFCGPKCPTRRPEIAGSVELGLARTGLPSVGAGALWPHEIKVSKAMTTVPSVAVATVAALLVYSLGRVIRSPLRRWRRCHVKVKNPKAPAVKREAEEYWVVR